MRYYKWIYLFIYCFMLSACYIKLSGNEYCHTKVNGALRIVTYNMNWAGNHFSVTAPNRTLVVLEQINADIVLLQEVTPFWFRAVKSRLAKLYPYRAYKDDSNAGGMAYLSKYPVSDFKLATPPVGWHHGLIMNVDSPLGLVQVLNLHLTPPLISKTNPNFSVVPYFSTCKARQKEISFFYSHIKKDKPTIIAGDFNEGDNGFVSYFLNQHGFKDAQKKQRTYTWGWKVGFVYLKRRLDHIFYNHYFKLEHAQVIHEGDSDHFPVVVDLIRI